jgi:hypothetical protein
VLARSTIFSELGFGHRRIFNPSELYGGFRNRFRNARPQISLPKLSCFHPSGRYEIVGISQALEAR